MKKSDNKTEIPDLQEGKKTKSKPLALYFWKFRDILPVKIDSYLPSDSRVIWIRYAANNVLTIHPEGTSIFQTFLAERAREQDLSSFKSDQSSATSAGACREVQARIAQASTTHDAAVVETSRGQGVGGSASADEPYYERQQEAWCGMHVINNYLQGPFATKDSCRVAVNHLCQELSETVGDSRLGGNKRGTSQTNFGGQHEDAAEHLDPQTGWLSIAVINVMAETLFGFAVDHVALTLSQVLLQPGDVSFFVNCNNRHWTLFQQRAPDGPWMHTNSIEGDAVYHGRRDVSGVDALRTLWAKLQQHYGGCSLHCITTTATLAGVHRLQPAGLRAMLPRPTRIVADSSTSTMTAAASQISLVTVNVAGLNQDDYRRSAALRITTILERVLRVKPHVISSQEVTASMLKSARLLLEHEGWRLYHDGDYEQEYFNATAIIGGLEVDVESESFGSNTNQRRHLLKLKSGPWSFINVHAESGPDANARDKREGQFQRLSQEHVLDTTHVHVLAGDFNIRDGEEHCLQSAGWTDAWCEAGNDIVGEEWTWKKGNSSARWDRIYTHSTSALKVSCSHYARLAEVRHGCTDHVAVHVVLQLTKELPYMGVPSASTGPSQDYRSSVSHSSGQWTQASNKPGTAAAHVLQGQPVQGATSERPTSTRPKAQRPQTSKCANRADIPIAKIAKAVTRAVDDVQNTFKAIMEEPNKKKTQTSLAVPHWNDLPSAAGFKNDRTRDQHGFQRRTTDAEKKKQQREYAYYVGWAESSGLSEETFRKSLLGAAMSNELIKDPCSRMQFKHGAKKPPLWLLQQRPAILVETT